MKKTGIFYALLIFILLFASLANGGDDSPIKRSKRSHDLNYKKDEIIVKYKNSGKSSSPQSFGIKSGFKAIKTYSRSGIKRLKIKDGMDIDQALEIYNNDPDVEYAEPNFLYSIQAAPNDTHFSKQWALKNTGQTLNETAGTVDADMDATEAWDITTGSSDVIVAVIDTGVDYNHPDLSANIWINPGEIAGNGVDDDGNGKIDDVRGWDFVDSDNDPMDYNDHGTHAAGIIAAVGNNNAGIAGISWSAKIMPVRGLDTEGYGYTSDLIAAIEYASENGADVINLSWGGEDYSQALKDAIDASSAVIVCAAGNDGINIDTSPLYPSGYDSSNIISVAATDQYDNLTYFSNYGTTSVDLGAPGENIYSTVPARVIIWSDNFDDGDISDWTTGGTQNEWSITGSQYYSSSYSLSESPVGYYNSNSNSWAVSPSFSLANRKGARLDFKINGASESDYDMLYVQASTNNTGWIDCELIDGTSNGEWFNYTVDLRDYEGKGTVYIRFRFVSDESYNYQGFYIDDVSVSAFSTSYSGTEYQYMDGTSMAAPHVSGTAALIESLVSDISVSELKNAILDGVDSNDEFAGRFYSSGRLNAYNAVSLGLIPCLDISLNIPEFATEGDGILYDSVIVSIDYPVEEDLTLFLSADDTSEILLPSSVIIPAGETSVTIDIEVIDDFYIDGSQTVTVTAKRPGCAKVTDRIQVHDNDLTTPITLEIPATASEGDGILSGTISVSALVEENITIALSSDNTDKLRVPSSAIIYAGQSSAQFDITIIDDLVDDGVQIVTITASAEGWNSVTEDISVSDNDNISWIDKTKSSDLSLILRDDVRDVIYLADKGNRHLVVIDALSLKIILRLALDSSFSDMAISKDNSSMVIVGKNVFLVDLETFEARQLSTDLDVISAGFDHNNDLMLLASGSIYQYDTDTETTTNSFGVGQNLDENIHNGLIKTNADGNILYVGERGISPASLYKIDISGDTPIFLAEDDHDDMGSNLRDFVISPLYNEIYLACGFPYSIQIVDGDTLEVTQNLEIEPYPGGVATNLKGDFIYGIPTSPYNNLLFQFYTENRELSFYYNLLSEVSNGEPKDRGLTVDRSGKRAFIIHGNDYYNSKYKVQVVDLNFPLKLTVPESAAESNIVLEDQGVLSLLDAPSDDQVVYLESSDTSEVQVPASVLFPAGRTSVSFDVTILDDSILDGSKSVTVKASAAGYPEAKSSIIIKDNETALLLLALPDEVAESDGVLSGQGCITVSQPVEDDVEITLSADIWGEIVFPRKIIIPKGNTSAYFDLNVINDVKIEGDQYITITASVEGWESAFTTVKILDDEIAALSVTNSVAFCEGDGTIYDGGVITLSATLSYDLEVFLSSNDSSEITVQSSVIIPAWETSATFDITVIDDSEKDGIQWVNITAHAEGFSDYSADFAVTDNDNIIWIDDTLSSEINCILRDNIRNVIYLGDAGNKQLVVIDSQSLKVIYRLSLDSSFKNLAISKDNSTLAVAGETLFLVDLETLDARELLTNLNVVSADFTQDGGLMLLTSEPSGYVYYFDPVTESVVKSFGSGFDLSDSIYKDSILKTDLSGETLYVAEDYYSNGSLFRFDISGETPRYIGGNTQGDAGSLIDFAISPRYGELYVTNRPVNIIDSGNLDLIKNLEAYDYSSGVALDLKGDFVYGLSSATGVIYQYDTKQKKINFQYNVLRENPSDAPPKRGIAIDQTGQRAFIVYGNNYRDGFKVQKIELNVPFKFTVPRSTYENDGVLKEQGVIRLLRPHSEVITAYLESSNPSEVIVPASVTIPAGQTSVTFDLTVVDDGLLDGTQDVLINCTIPEIFSSNQVIHVNDNESATINILLPASVKEGDGTLTGKGQVTVDSPVDSDVKVLLTSSDESEIKVPYAVIIRAGHDSSEFNFTVSDDYVIDGLQTASIYAIVEGWNSGSDSISVVDNDTFLTINVTSYLREGDGQLDNGGSVSIVDALDYNLTVYISTSDSSEVKVSSFATILAGETTAFFDLFIIDDSISDGRQLVSIDVAASDFISDSAIINVLDNENEYFAPSWIMYQGNPSHTGYVPVKLVPYFNERWVKELSSVALNPVTAAGGRVFVSTIGYFDNNDLFALIAENGEIVWEKNYIDIFSSNPPAYNNGMVYIQTGDNDENTYLRAYSAATGTEIFKSPHRAQWERYFAPTIFDNKVYVNGGHHGGAYAFDGLTGEQLWFVNLNGYDQWTPAVNEDYVFAYTGEHSPELTVVNRINGGEELNIPDPNFEWSGWSMNLAPVIGSSNNVVTIHNSRLINFDLVNRNIKYEIQQNFIGQPSLARGKIYAIESGFLGVRDESNGSLIWAWEPPDDDLTGNIIVTDSHIFTSTDSTTYAIDKNTRIEVWNYPVGGHLALSEESLYIATDSGSLVAIDVVVYKDADDDGLKDELEEAYCTDPDNDDSDGDGLLDGFEDSNYNGEVDPGETDPCKYDSDEDGVKDGINMMSVRNNWNLVSLSQVPDETAISTVLKPVMGSIVSVWAYENGNWQVYDPQTPDFSDLNSMTAGRGYWLNMYNNALLSVSGNSPSDEISLSEGWNLIGYNSKFSMDTASAVSAIEGNIISIWRFKEGKWQVYDPQNPDFSDLTTMEPGYGYWFNMSAPCLWEH